MKRRFDLPHAAGLLGLICAVAPASAQTYTAAAGWDPVHNPAANGLWEYGYKTSAAGAFTLYNQSGNVDFGNNPFSIPGWTVSGALPEVAFNPSNTAAIRPLNGTTTLLDSHEFLLHPGSNGEFSVIRFLAPASGSYQIAATFEGIDSKPTTTDTHILLNGVSLYDSQISDYKQPQQFSSPAVMLNAGDAVDFSVGFGANGNDFYDSTGFYGSVTRLSSVPAPSSLLVAACGVLSGAVVLRRRRPR